MARCKIALDFLFFLSLARDLRLSLITLDKPLGKAYLPTMGA